MPNTARRAPRAGSARGTAGSRHSVRRARHHTRRQTRIKITVRLEKNPRCLSAVLGCNQGFSTGYTSLGASNKLTGSPKDACARVRAQFFCRLSKKSKECGYNIRSPNKISFPIGLPCTCCTDGTAVTDRYRPLLTVTSQLHAHSEDFLCVAILRAILD